MQGCMAADVPVVWHGLTFACVLCMILAAGLTDRECTLPLYSILAELAGLHGC